MVTIFHERVYSCISLLLFAFFLQFGHGSLAIDMQAVVRDADLVVTGKFKDFADTDYFVLFEEETVHKGELKSPYFVVYFSESLVNQLNKLKPGVRMLFILNSREDADISVRKRFDESSLCSLSLYIPAIEHVEFVVFNLIDQQEYLQIESGYYRWLAEVSALEKTDRWQEYRNSFESSNWLIREQAIRSLADEVNDEIESSGTFGQKAKCHELILDTTNNRYMECYALKFFSENHYDSALSVMLRRFLTLPDTANYMISYYLDALRNHPDSTVAAILSQEIDKFDDAKRLWQFSKEIGEIISLSLGDRQEPVFAELLSRFVDRAEDSVFVEDMLLKILPLFVPYTSTYRTELLIRLLKTTGQEVIYETMAAGGEESALQFLRNVFVNREYKIRGHILNALGNYTESQIGALLIDFIKNSENDEAKNDGLYALSSVLAHTSSDPMPMTLQFIQERVNSVIEWDTRKREVERLLGVLAASKSDKTAQMTMEQIEGASDSNIRRALIRTLSSKKFDIVSDLLFNTIFDESEADDMREAVVWTFASCEDVRAQDALVRIAASKRLPNQLRESAINILIDWKKNPSLAAMPLIDLLRTFTTWQEYDELHRSIGLFGDLHNKDLTEKERIELDKCLATFYRKYMHGKPVIERFDFLRTLRKRTDFYLPKTFRVATEDADSYIREEAFYALRETENRMKDAKHR